MKVKLALFFLSILFLWGSLAAYSQQTYPSKTHQIKIATESLSVAVAPTFAELEVTHFPLPPFSSFAFSKAIIKQQRISNHSPSFHKSAKAYIIFRSLRN